MKLLLRKIRIDRWYEEERPDWVGEEDIHADPLCDFIAYENAITLWHITDGKANFKQVVAAVSATSGHLTQFDYGIIEEDLISDLAIRMEHTHGNSASNIVNANFHRDLVEISGLKLVELAKAFWTLAEFDRVEEREVGRWIKERGGEIALGDLQKGMRKDLAKI